VKNFIVRPLIRHATNFTSNALILRLIFHASTAHELQSVQLAGIGAALHQ